MRRTTTFLLLWCLILLGGIVAGAAPVSGATPDAVSTTPQADKSVL